MRIRPSTSEDGARVVEIWRNAVQATHDFLSPADLAAIDAQVEQFLPKTPLLLVIDEEDRPAGFMGMTGHKVDSLFIDPMLRGGGIGRLLIEHAAMLYASLTVDVNEQNAQAVGFYERMGFVQTGRSDTDDQGRPYPLIHMRLGTVSEG
ncbi:MAG TPA: acetyltransferase [Hyphomonadaceae bacterium]|nr:acetyltransferase [Hyphomonadaceae bacterium]HPN04472.1 acetyltransferase [Hyphomonadaceae bacterium]